MVARGAVVNDEDDDAIIKHLVNRVRSSSTRTRRPPPNWPKILHLEPADAEIRHRRRARGGVVGTSTCSWLCWWCPSPCSTSTSRRAVLLREPDPQQEHARPRHMPVTWRTASVLVLLAAEDSQPSHVSEASLSPAPHVAHALPPRFHHIHLVPGDPNQFADYYSPIMARRVERGEFWGHPGVRDATSALLFSASESDRPGDRSVIWQMGWGTVSLDQSYRQHYAQEVDWAPPYASMSADSTCTSARAMPRKRRSGIAMCSAVPSSLLPRRRRGTGRHDDGDRALRWPHPGPARHQRADRTVPRSRNRGSHRICRQHVCGSFDPACCPGAGRSVHASLEKDGASHCA